MKRLLTALVAAFAVSSPCAQTSTGTEAASAATLPSVEASPAAATENACCRVPANTVVDLEVLDLLNSSRQKRGDKFRLRVMTAVVIDGRTLILPGTVGVGEIIHAAAARGGGAPGELLIAARLLDIDGQIIPLRGLKLGVTGGDNSGMALGVSLVAGPFALFVRGREIEIPAGTRVTAKVAQDVALTPTELPSSSTAVSTKE